MVSNRLSQFQGLAAVCIVILVIYTMDFQPLPRDSIHQNLNQPSSIVQTYLELEGQKGPVTIVTAYFPFKKSKHSLTEYESWMKNFLSKVVTPMVIYTEASVVPLLTQFRNGSPTSFQIYEDVWSLPPLVDLHEVYTKQVSLDPEQLIHSPELYAIWNSKPWMLSNAATSLNPFSSEYFYWVDIGCFRDANHNFKFWPSLDKIQPLFEQNNTLTLINTPHLFTVGEFKDFDINLRNNSYEEMSKVIFMVGTFFGGTKTAVKFWADIFYSAHDLMLKNDLFVGKDQNLMNWVAVHYSDELLVTSSTEQMPWDGCGDIWFYFQNWYADEAERYSNCTVNARVVNMTEFLTGSAIHTNEV